MNPVTLFLLGTLVGAVFVLIASDPTGISKAIRRDKELNEKLNASLAAYHDEWAKRLDQDQLILQLEIALADAKDKLDQRNTSGSSFCPSCKSLYPNVLKDGCSADGPHPWHELHHRELLRQLPKQRDSV